MKQTVANAYTGCNKNGRLAVQSKKGIIHMWSIILSLTVIATLSVNLRLICRECHVDNHRSDLSIFIIHCSSPFYKESCVSLKIVPKVENRLTLLPVHRYLSIEIVHSCQF